MADEGNAHYAPAPGIAVVADTAKGLARGRDAAAASGAHVPFAVDPGEALTRLEASIRLDAVLVMIDGAVDDAIDRLFAAIAEAAEAGRLRGVVSVPFAHLDAAAARLDHRDIEILCDPSDPELAGALGLATIRREAALHDPKREAQRMHLLRISEEVGRIAKALAALSQDESRAGKDRSDLGEAPFAYRAEPIAPAPLDADRVRHVIRMRRLRDRFFDSGLFADPAWDMLLDLMAARLEQRDVAVSSLCIAAAVPPTTALRWIKSMTETGLLERHADPRDGRRVFIALSQGAASSVEGWFAAVRNEGGSAVV